MSSWLKSGHGEALDKPNGPAKTSLKWSVEVKFLFLTDKSVVENVTDFFSQKMLLSVKFQ
jgi:hypothetical protein